MIFMAIIDFLIATAEFAYAVNLFSVGRMVMGRLYVACAIMFVVVGIILIYREWQQNRRSTFLTRKRWRRRSDSKVKKFTLRWCDGKTEEIKGYDIADAIRRAGYGSGDICAMDCYYETIKEDS